MSHLKGQVPDRQRRTKGAFERTRAFPEVRIEWGIVRWRRFRNVTRCTRPDARKAIGLTMRGFGRFRRIGLDLAGFESDRSGFQKELRDPAAILIR